MKIFVMMLLAITFGVAHKLNIFLAEEGDRVFLSAYFASGASCKNCNVVVKDDDHNILQKGTSNEKGEFIITKLASSIIVSVDGGNGHSIQQSLSLTEHNHSKGQLSHLKEQHPFAELEKLKQENARLKSELALLQEKSSFSEIIRMVVALFIVFVIFMLLKRIKR